MSDKIKILTISDHPLVSSGVGTQTRYIIEGLLKTGRYQVRSFGGAMKHGDYRPQRIKEFGDDWIIFPIDGYGNEQAVRDYMNVDKPDAVWFMTDPRFFGWLFGMSDEIRDRGVPLLYYHVWDNYPVPKFNKSYYDSCDFVGCISKLTHDIVKKLGHPHTEYIPHAVNTDIFKPISEKEKIEKRYEILKDHKDKFIIFYNSRNARRKMTSDVVKVFKYFIDKVGKDKAFLFMHTDPNDKEGANLVEVAKMLGLEHNQLAFSTARIPPEKVADFYRISDVTVNISNNEGFGLSCLESLCCGVPVIINKTGGLQDQAITEDGTELGAVLKPATKTLTGSQQIPYIFDDRCSDEDFLNALIKLYEMGPEKRRELGQLAAKHASENFKLEDMIASWDNAITSHVNRFRQAGGYPDRIRFTKV